MATRTTTWTGWALLAAALLQVAAPVAQSLSDASGPAEGSQDLLITPVGWAFSIWSLIYLLTVVHAVAAIVRGDGVGNRRFVIDLIVLYLAAAVWIVVSATGENWGTFLVLALMTVVAIDAALLAVRARPADPAWTGTLARATAGLYAGWVSAAVFLNAGTAALDLGWLDADETDWQVGLLVVAVLFALAVNSLLTSAPAYAAAVVWALVGIAVAVRGESRGALAVAVVAALALVAQTTLAWRAGRSPTLR